MGILIFKGLTARLYKSFGAEGSKFLPLIGGKLK
jgi:hypothetical protein